MSDYRTDVAAMAEKFQSDLRAMLGKVDDMIVAPSASVRPHVGSTLNRLTQLRAVLSGAFEMAAAVSADAVQKRTDATPSTGNVTPPGRETGLPVDYRNEHAEDAIRSNGVPMTAAEQEQRREQAMRGELKPERPVAVSNVGDDGPALEQQDDAARLLGKPRVLPPQGKPMPEDVKR